MKHWQQFQWLSWRRLELAFLGIYALLFYAFAVKRSVDLSRDFSQGKQQVKLWGLQQGWISKQLIDLSDSQWRNFRGNLPVLTAVMAGFTLLGFALGQGFGFGGKGRSRFWLLVSLIYVLYLHGACVIFIVAIALGNYAIVKCAGGTRLFPIALWSYNLAFLIGNRVYEGYSFASLGEHWAILDEYRGAFRWHISFNMIMLRMVSFGFDYHWAILPRSSTVDWEKHDASCHICRSGSACYLALQEKPLAKGSYNSLAYICYLLYAPLYIAGPIISFNSFTSQLISPQKSYTRLQVAAYGVRWLACMLLMEFMTHYCYFNSFAVSKTWQILSPLDIFLVSYGVLNFMWLKFLLIWRFFRFWALASGIEAPENMLRCVNNCYDLEGFWRSWHASYNRWLVRYLYVPLGGAQWRLLNVWIIFTFVALWHDLEWKLLSWAWVTCILWVPELLAKAVIRLSWLQGFRKSVMYREVCAIAGALNITGLMTANLVGFVVGPSGMKSLSSQLLTRQNTIVLVGILTSLYVGTKIMFRVRESENNKKVKQMVD
ncbi:hypothetical protein O6H91_09G037700 [Diphasiastrum complanatum]|uniref:Uncharacterized protein n=2 Tax=Diphasiastrum complanatum TaxID=34168 RepID=A0ACC2CN24_DIPCM|nr:hypothetical protein O6H91_09G037700 [Diphasiastrum complanatum]KAJ7543423.1 hypothetical protein O6H91_09G037700 [Diphasiastrum complanatum]